MNRRRCTSGLAVALLGLITPTLPAAAQEVASGKIPITTASAEARQHFLIGRDLAEKIRATDARQHLMQAVAIDPNFAYGHLALANTAPSAKEFFESMKRAVALVDHASEGERLMILAADAGVNGDVEAQGQYLTRLVQEFPADERGHDAIGNYYFGRQDYEKAIAAYDRATQINPNFSTPYNSLGYAQRAVGNYAGAEKAFQKYIELIPNEPNPYDSYAELLMKMGRFEESIVNYQKALTKNPNFVASYVGIGNNQIFMGRSDAARNTFNKLLTEIARNDGERRNALFWVATSYAHDGNHQAALDKLQAMYQIAEAKGDMAAMAGDVNLMGNLLLHSGDNTGARAKYSKAVEIMDMAEVSDRVKENTRRNQLYFQARVDLAKNDLASAKAKTAAYGEQAKAHGIPFELRRHHELLGMIALHEKSHASAIQHLAQANQQDPAVLYMLAKAYHGAGDHAKAREVALQATNFNGLNFNYAFVRAKAAKMVKEHGG